MESGIWNSGIGIVVRTDRLDAREFTTLTRELNHRQNEQNHWKMAVAPVTVSD